MYQLLFVAGVVLSAFAAPSVPQPTCFSTSRLQEMVRDEVQDAELRLLEGSDAVQFVESFNAVLPQSHVAAEEILIVSKPQMPAAILIFFSDGCASGRAVLPLTVVQSLLLQIERSGA